MVGVDYTILIVTLATILFLGLFTKYNFQVIWSALIFLTYSAYQNSKVEENFYLLQYHITLYNNVKKQNEDNLIKTLSPLVIKKAMDIVLEHSTSEMRLWFFVFIIVISFEDTRVLGG